MGAGIDAELGSATGPGAVSARVISRAVVGGTISQATGGKFANGAATAAFSAIASEVGRSSNSVSDGNNSTNNAGVEEVSEATVEAGTCGKYYCVDDQGSCLLYTSPSPRDLSTSRMPSSA